MLVLVDRLNLLPASIARHPDVITKYIYYVTHTCVHVCVCVCRYKYASLLHVVDEFSPVCGWFVMYPETVCNY